MPTPTCPRCGYDLSGAIDAWQGACPLTGVCSECGLQLEWARVLNPALNTPKWSFEHTNNRRMRRMLATCAVAMLPWVFWRQLRMEHPIRPRRLLIFALMLLLLTHLAFSIAHGCETWATARYIAQQYAAAGSFLHEEPLVSAALAGLWPYRTHTLGGTTIEVEPYSIVWLALPLCLIVSAPFVMLLLSDTFKMARVRRLHILRGAIYGITGPVAATAVVALATAVNIAIELGNLGAPVNWPMWVAIGAMLAALVWYILWWWHFIRRYLQLPRGRLITILILIIAALLTLIVTIKLAIIVAQNLN